MRIMRNQNPGRLAWLAGALWLIAALVPVACEKKPATPPVGGTVPAVPHAAAAPAIPLGTTTVGGFEISTSVEGAVAAGREAHANIDVKGPSKPAAVRVWIGAQDGAGSVKSRADAEGAGYHAHVDAPAVLPAGSKLWVEIEDAEGKTHVGGFDLKL